MQQLWTIFTHGPITALAGRKGVLCQPMTGRVAATSLSSELMPDGVNIQLLSRDLF